MQASGQLRYDSVGAPEDVCLSIVSSLVALRSLDALSVNNGLARPSPRRNGE
jgi:hypothetical protein